MIRKADNPDTTIEDIHRTRQRMSEKFGGDTAAILDDARQRQAASGRPIWQPPATAPASETSLPPTDTSK